MPMTFSYDDGFDKGGNKGRIRRILVSWTSDASGDASGTSLKVNGYLLKGVTVPTDGPTDDYDITLTDSDGADLLENSEADLTNRDTTDTETVSFALTDGAAPIAAYPAVCSEITVTVAAAGNTKSGLLVLYYEAC